MPRPRAWRTHRAVGPAVHLRWAWTERQQFLARAGQFLADGAGVGEYLWYVGTGPVRRLQMELADVGGLGDAPRSERVQVATVEEFYRLRTTGVLDPLASAHKLSSLSAAAVARGYSGVRIVVDATALLRTGAQRAAFAHFEHLLGRSPHHRAVSVLCTADARTLSTAVVADSR
jgi:hypothetical protein